MITEQRLREIARIVSQGHTASHDYSEFVSACAELLATRSKLVRVCAERDAARAELEQWPRQIAAALNTTAHVDDLSPSTWAGHVRREHEAHTACFDRLAKARAENELLAKQRGELLHALVCRSDPLSGAAYQELAKRTIGDVRAAIAAEQPKPPHTHEHLRLAALPNHDEGRTCFLCGGDVPSGFKHEHGKGVCVEQPKPAESRPWWEVFVRERWQGVAMHDWPREDRERHIFVMADEAHKCGLAPNEISRAVQEAVAELLGEQPKPAGGGA